ncbi:endonuclease/exonuclease/phosphatase family protein [Mangrovicoccus algicola]|uniref:Endonuclease/exonuclease/phosphatase family protein n=1 Tax=Mangrovicoccus algicola TaxID=2771008 RepID=A0A8J6ZAI9_9RHOB|nr:endonuclease/exonuclease/phosphatase family protein [Mangrovicoccus algicola]MBE3639176.1 endonuclease/exonuclease/phosphatase family protein [Mangrovicoccus algicola]
MWLRALFLCLWGAAAPAAELRVAVYNAELDREGPGLLLRDILRGAEDVAAAAALIARVSPDILLLTRFDYDLDLAALSAFNDRLGPARYPHLFALRPNTGRATGLDLDRDGRLGEPEDAQGFGRFAGQNGMAILSRHPFGPARDFSALLWRDLPGARLPMAGAGPFWGAEVLDHLRLSTTGHWDVPVGIGDRVLHLLAFHASPPVFDGPEDRNGLRAAEELRFWRLYLDGAFGPPPPVFVLLGTANIDPGKGDGRRAEMRALLEDPRLQDPAPADGTGGTDTADFGAAPGRLRTDYLLPAAGISVQAAGLAWPEAAEGGRHALVWADLRLPPP